jgi:hypothetical protein
MTLDAIDLAKLVGFHLGAFGIGWSLGLLFYTYRRVMDSAT